MATPINVGMFKCHKICLMKNPWNRASFTWKKQSCLSLLSGSRPKSARASHQQCAHSAPDFIKIHFCQIRERSFLSRRVFHDSPEAKHSFRRIIITGNKEVMKEGRKEGRNEEGKQEKREDRMGEKGSGEEGRQHREREGEESWRRGEERESGGVGRAEVRGGRRGEREGEWEGMGRGKGSRGKKKKRDKPPKYWDFFTKF